MDQQLIALYELKRQSFLIGYIQNPENFDSALAFAYYNRLAPIFHEDSAREKYESDPFAEAYSVKAEFIDEVLKYVDDREHEGDLTAIEFYNLEDKFGGYKANRIELIYALEYARIDGRFNDAVWAAIERNAPAEANNLQKEFSPKDVHFG
ncbi:MULTISPECIES: hypothetical protein [pseudomallei group]|uniref:hypothetical protein n=1 Tax=pseudomallei group TaxID=111527 RepID=UPI00014F926D|nr:MULTISPECIES: hypothetical protein [pseudomallei group]AGR73280.1 hypothetical protein BDL_894 [Burkholderia pseudomallei MSHR305]AHK65148.1 hypothetical protein BBX_2835 [Burkholderia pseudomallei MSHR520]AIP79948.1 hypothetical protein JE55_2736 [Burkholderia pseudomallei]APY97806.1 hypothetical protein BGI49_01765 [Burkholderia pseudomallei]APZ11394.1 hypothetical protein BGI52_01765 [Burkholderia pseudomallei]